MNSGKHADQETVLLRSILITSGLMVVVFTVGSWCLYGWSFAQSVLIGGILVNGSFFLLKNDVIQLVHKVGSAGGQVKTVKRVEKIRFFLKFYARLIVLALLLFVLATKVSINMIGLTLGLATIMLSVFLVVLGRGKILYSVQSLKGA